MTGTHTPPPWRIEGKIISSGAGTRPREPIGIIISTGVNAEGDGPERYVGRLMNASPADQALVLAAPMLLAALEGLLAEAEAVFNCMADATGIARLNYPESYARARAAIAIARTKP